MTDVVVIGAGVNGMVAAAYLAKAGRDVLVVEKRDVAGGLASRYALAPGISAAVGPDNSGLMLPRVVKDLGLRLEPLDPFVANASGLSLWRDPGKTADAIRKVSARDAEAYPRFDALVTKLCAFLRPVLSKPAPSPEIESGADLVEILKLGWGFRQLGQAAMHELLRIIPMSLSDFLDEWFENDVLKATLGSAALEGVCLGPRAAGTAALFLYQRLGETASAPELVERLSEKLGTKLRLNALVSRILVEDGKVGGVVLESGEEIRAASVLSGLAARTTFLELMEPSELPASFVSEVDNIRYRGVTAKLNLALEEPARFACGEAPVVVVGQSLDDYERAYEASKYGEISKRPMLRCFQRGNLLSVTAQFFPYGAGTGDAITERILETLADAAPNVRQTIRAQDVWTAADYEERLGLPEGNWHQGEMALDQMFFMRPVPGWSRYETPIEGLYLGGAATHPGGGITGAPGYNAAMRILAAAGR